MKLRKIDPNKIMVPEVRVTAQFDPELLELFQQSVAQMGIVAPIICCEVGGQIVLVDGLHRLTEAIRNKQTVIDVVVQDGDMVDVLTRNIFVDHLRGKTPVSEMVKVIELLWKEYQLDSEKIAAKTGLSRDYVEKLQLISELTPFIRAGLDSGEIGIGHAVALTKLKDPVRQETVFHQQRLYHWTVKELEAYVKDVLALLEPPKTIEPLKEPPPPPKIKCFYCSGEHEPAEIANPNTCRECAAVLIMSIQEARRPAATDKKSPSSAD